MKIAKKYQRPFVAETSKLTRLMSIVEQSMAEGQLPHRERFEVRMSSGKTYETEDLNHVFQPRQLTSEPHRSPLD